MIDFQSYLRRNSNIFLEDRQLWGGWLGRGWGSRVEREERGDVCMVNTQPDSQSPAALELDIRSQ